MEWLGVGEKHGDGTGICTLIKLQGLGVLHLQTTNLAVLTTWVGRLMSPETDMTCEVLNDS